MPALLTLRAVLPPQAADPVVAELSEPVAAAAAAVHRLAEALSGRRAVATAVLELDRRAFVKRAIGKVGKMARQVRLPAAA